MVALLLILVLLLLLFGGLGIFIARAFFIALAAVLIVALVAGIFGRRGRHSDRI